MVHSEHFLKKGVFVRERTKAHEKHYKNGDCYAEKRRESNRKNKYNLRTHALRWQLFRLDER